jgi:hypothetical protein
LAENKEAAPTFRDAMATDQVTSAVLRSPGPVRNRLKNEDRDEEGFDDGNAPVVWRQPWHSLRLFLVDHELRSSIRLHRRAINRRWSFNALAVALDDRVDLNPSSMARR